MRRGLLAAVVAGLLVMAACGSGSSSKDEARPASAQAASNEGSGTNTVHLPKSYKFVPSSITVEVGDEVTWINEDDFPHTVQTLDDKVDRKLGVGETVSITFDDAGTFKYTCSLHPTQMSGQVVVKEPSA